MLIINGKGDRVNLHKLSVPHGVEEVVEIPRYAFCFQPLENGSLWFYSGYYLVAGDHRLFLTDASGKLKNVLLPNEFPPIGQFGGHVFFQGYDRILFREPLKTTI